MPSLEDLALFQTQSVNVTGGERPDRVRGAFVSANYFKFFNLNPIVGRTFADGEDRPGGAKLAVVNEKMWRERLSSDPNVGAKKLILNGEPYSVIGVVTESFKQPLDPDVEVWMPMSQLPPAFRAQGRASRFLMGYGRIADGVTLQQARSELTNISSQLQTEHQDTNKDISEEYAGV